MSPEGQRRRRKRSRHFNLRYIQVAGVMPRAGKRGRSWEASCLRGGRKGREKYISTRQSHDSIMPTTKTVFKKAETCAAARIPSRLPAKPLVSKKERREGGSHKCFSIHNDDLTDSESEKKGNRVSKCLSFFSLF